MRLPLIVLALLGLVAPLAAQPFSTKPLPMDKFRQLEELLPTPNEQRTASGAPGHGYWQQRADYVIDVELDDAKQRITGKAAITYANHSPDALTYLWLQLDSNFFSHNSETRSTSALPRGNAGANPFDKMAYDSLDTLLLQETYGSDLNIASVTDGTGAALPYTIVKTMMRVDLPRPLAPGASTTFSVAWSYFINNAKLLAVRTGYEYFEKDKNYPMKSRSGTRAWRRTTTRWVGRTNSTWAVENSPSSSVTILCASPCRATTWSPPPAYSKIPKRC